MMNHSRSRHPVSATLVLAILILSFGSAAALEQTVGLLEYDESASFDGYTLLVAKSSPNHHLIDNYGRVVHTWEMEYTKASPPYFLESGKLLRSAKSVDSLGVVGRELQLIAWDGTIEWSFEYKGDTWRQHHDIHPMPNGNVLVLASEDIPYDDAIAAGRNPDSLLSTMLKVDYVAEIKPYGSNSGAVVWEWHIWDHLIQDYDSTADNYGVVEDHPERIDLNYVEEIYADWTHGNSVAYNEELDQVVISFRHFHELWVIDHSTTTEEAAGSAGGNSGMGGDLIYRWGNPRTYKRGTEDDQILYGPHDIHWIEDTLSGAGNILLYNNGWTRPEGPISTIEEIATPVGPDGQYPRPSASEAHAPDSSVWTYAADPPEDLFSATGSSAQRLPNGNTLLCAARVARLIEVTPDSQVVWEYKNPLSGSGPLHQGQVDTDFGTLVFRARRYSPDYPGLAGRDLIPGAPVELYPITMYGTAHSPSIPVVGDSVVITSHIVVDSGVVLNRAQLYVDVGDTNTVLNLFDDGAHHDGAAGDSVYGAVLPPMEEGTAVSYYVYTETTGTEAVTDPVYAVENDVYYSYTVGAGFVCGDIDGSGDELNVADLVFLVTYMFQQGPEPPVFRATDVDGSGEGPNVADLVYLASYMFSGGPVPQCP